MGGLFLIRIFDYLRFNIEKMFTNFNYKEKKLFLFTFILFSTQVGMGKYSLSRFKESNISKES
jgi:hypothetical protein